MIAGRALEVRGLVPLLRRPHFRGLLRVRLCSQMADGIFQSALASFIFFSPERSATVGAAAGIVLLTVVPYSIFAPLAGELLDRWSRRLVLVTANAGRSVAVVAVASATLVGRTALVAILVLACMSVNRLFLTALGASLPRVVPPASLITANALVPTCGTLAFLVGGGLGYLLRRLLPLGDSGDAALLLVAVGGYGTAAVFSYMLPSSLLGPERGDACGTASRTARWSAIKRGGQRVLGCRATASALAMLAFSRWGFAVTTMAIVLLCRNYFQPLDPAAGLARLAVIVVASGIGFLVAALMTPRAAAWLGTQSWIAVMLGLAAAAQAALVVSLNWKLIIVVAFTLAVAVQGIKICVDSILQVEVEDVFRGRAFAFADLAFNLALVAAALTAVVFLPSNGVCTGISAVLATGQGLASGWTAHQARSAASAAGGESGP